MNSLRFKSKTDTWLLIVLLGGVAVAFIGVIAAAGTGLDWPVALLTIAIGCLLPLWLLLSTHYTLTDTDLLVKAGPFKWRIPLGAIKAVTPTRSPLSSPALSLDRLRIEYADAKALMISPEDRERFLRELQTRRRRAIQ